MFDSDPCPRVRKYAEVAYKCRPGNHHIYLEDWKQ